MSNNSLGNALSNVIEGFGKKYLEPEKEPSVIEKNARFKFTPIEIYEIALRNGIYIIEKRDDTEKSDVEKVDLPEYVPCVKMTSDEIQEYLKDLNKKQPQNQENNNNSISKESVNTLISEANKKLKENGIPAGEYQGKYLQALTFITLYCKKYININSLTSEDDSFIYDINSTIIDSTGEYTKNIDYEFIVEFLELLRKKFGVELNKDTFPKIISIIVSCDNNRELLEFTKELFNRLSNLKQSETLEILQTLHDKVIFNGNQQVKKEDYSEDADTQKLISDLEEKGNLRNIEFRMLQDILDAIEYREDEAEELKDFIKSIANLNAKEINEYWRRFKGEKILETDKTKSTFTIPENRVQKFLKNKTRTPKKRDEISKKKKKDKGIFKGVKSFLPKKFITKKRIAVTAALFLAYSLGKGASNQTSVENDPNEFLDFREGRFDQDIVIDEQSPFGNIYSGASYQYFERQDEDGNLYYEIKMLSNNGIEISFKFDPDELENSPELQRIIFGDSPNKNVDEIIAQKIEKLQNDESQQETGEQNLDGEEITEDKQ